MCFSFKPAALQLKAASFKTLQLRRKCDDSSLLIVVSPLLKDVCLDIWGRCSSGIGLGQDLDPMWPAAWPCNMYLRSLQCSRSVKIQSGWSRRTWMPTGHRMHRGLSHVKSHSPCEISSPVPFNHLLKSPMESQNASNNEASTAAVTLPERLVRPQSDSTGELLHWEAVRKLRNLGAF